MSVREYALVDYTRDGTGQPILPPAGYTMQSGSDGYGVWNLVTIPVLPPSNFVDYGHDNNGGDNAPIAIGAPFRFETLNLASAGTTITQLSNTRFQLGPIGTYRVTWQSSINEPGQMALALSDSGTPGTPTVVLRTNVGRATGTSQISGTSYIQTFFVNAHLELWNSFSPAALTPTPIGGGTGDNWTNITITQVA